MENQAVQSEILEKILTKANSESFENSIFSKQGKRKGLVKSGKPKNGIEAYVWRMCRFYSGDDVTLPMMAKFDLMNGIKNETGLSSTEIGWSSEVFVSISRILDDLAIDFLNKRRIPLHGLSRWKRAFYG